MKRLIFKGFDVARSGHKSSMVELCGSGEDLWVTAVESHRGMSWEEQEQWVGEALLRAERIAVDATGIGNAFVERLTKLYGAERVIAVVFTLETKAQMVTGLKLALERGILHVPPDPNLRRAVLALKRVVTQAGNITFGATENIHGHADEAWALALALRAARLDDARDFEGILAGMRQLGL